MSLPLNPHRIREKTLNILIKGPSRGYIRCIINAKEAERKKALQWSKSAKQQLDGARKKLARVGRKFALDPKLDDIGTSAYNSNYYLLEQEVIELEKSCDDARRIFEDLGEEIEELWGELADAWR